MRNRFCNGPHLSALCLALVFSVGAQAQQPEFTRQPDGITLPSAGGTLRIQVMTDSILRVTDLPAGATERPSITVVAHPDSGVQWDAAATPAGVTLTTARIRATVDRATGRVSFADATTGQPILAEAERTISPATVQEEKTAHIRQQWQPSEDESLYGLAQQQLGIVDIKGYDMELWQHNTHVVVPYLVSSKGYGIFWDNNSYTRFGDLRPWEPIPAYSLLDAKGTPGGLTLTYPNMPGSQPGFSSGLEMNFVSTPGNNRAPDMEWNGSVLASETGDYQFHAYSNGGLKVWIDGKLVMSHWRQGWLAADDQVKLPLVAGRRYSLRILTDGEQQSRMHFNWKTPNPDAKTSLWSEVGDGVDYYFVYGPKLDDVVAGYRTLTGRANMMPQWVFGLWQSRQRYETAEQSLDVVHEFRKRQIPLDNIVQDWQYWKPDSWGAHDFDPTRFPDPKGWIDQLHALHTHMMISVWGKFNPNTDNAKEMQAKGYLYQHDLDVKMTDWIGYPYTFYDAFNPGARKLFWTQMDKAIFSKGADAWWMDASEPDLLPGEPPSSPDDQKIYMNPTFLGTASRMLNGWGLMNADAVYTGQRSSAPNQRVFTLTRSGYAGQQRFSATTWSGDVTSTWTALAKQIPAGLGMSIAGVPYWTTDTAGYTMQSRFNLKNSKDPNAGAADPAAEDEFRELNARWFEFSTFTPLLRVHGEVRPREMYLFGETSPVYRTELKFDHLRYRMFPYVYSLAGAVTQHGATIMRPLVMDFPTDVQARTLTDEFMFGPSLLVAPILQYKQREREVYLPGTTPWFNLWSGVAAASATVTADAPYDAIPVFVRAGSILPYGPDQQYIGEKSADTLTLHLYEGADGAFTLYEDQGLTYDYEQGAFTEIPMSWSEATHTLTIGKRKGSFPQMLAKRRFEIVVTSKSAPVGYSATPKPVKTVSYEGAAITVKLP